MRKIESQMINAIKSETDWKSGNTKVVNFFNDESCGQCTPCRVGSEKLLNLIQEKGWNEPLINELSVAMQDASICGLGQAAPNPVLSAIRFFPEHIK